MRYALTCPARSARAGVSLLEVLISIFVLSIGLLGVAAVIPVATFEMVETAKADRAAACGEAMLQDISVRGTLNPDAWRDVTGAGVLFERQTADGSDPTYAEPHGLEFGESFAVDPLYISQTAAAERFGIVNFPYNPLSLGNPVSSIPGHAKTTRMQRVTWTGVKNFSLPLSRSVFMWRDDLEFPVPDDSSLRPEQLFERVGGNPVKAENTGRYTWLLTVVPSSEHVDFPSLSGDMYTFPENAPLYDVSVVVFYRRGIDPPSVYFTGAGAQGEPPGERQAQVRFLGGGLGGGDVELMILPNQSVEYLDIKENEWLMVSGGYPGVRRVWNHFDGAKQYVSLAAPVGVHKWYRIVAVGELTIEDANGNGSLDPGEDINANGVLDRPYRNATLAGPDWNPAWINDWNGDGALEPPVATLLDGVIGVSTSTIELR